MEIFQPQTCRSEQGLPAGPAGGAAAIVSVILEARASWSEVESPNLPAPSVESGAHVFFANDEPGWYDEGEAASPPSAEEAG